MGPHARPHNRNLSELYAIAVINRDRRKHGLSPVLSSNNRAAQAHAEDILKTKQLSHWTTDGMKPYMRYSICRGTGYVQQNASYKGFSESDMINKYKSGFYSFSKIYPIKSIDELEYDMIYNDSTSQWGHRDNILGKHHTHVSIGIAYDDYYFAFVQNFEGNYIQLNKPIIQENSNKHKKNIEVSGRIINNNKIHGIYIFYDKVPNRLLYEQHKDDRSYGLGELIAVVVKPLPSNYYYVNTSAHTLIQADKWWSSSFLSRLVTSGDHNQQSIDIEFDILPLLKTHGVYTIVIYLQDNHDDTFPVTSYCLFTRTTRI